MHDDFEAEQNEKEKVEDPNDATGQPVQQQARVFQSLVDVEKAVVATLGTSIAQRHPQFVETCVQHTVVKPLHLRLHFLDEYGNPVAVPVPVPTHEDVATIALDLPGEAEPSTEAVQHTVEEGSARWWSNKVRILFRSDTDENDDISVEELANVSQAQLRNIEAEYIVVPFTGTPTSLTATEEAHQHIKLPGTVAAGTSLVGAVDIFVCIARPNGYEVVIGVDGVPVFGSPFYYVKKQNHVVELSDPKVNEAVVVQSASRKRVKNVSRRTGGGFVLEKASAALLAACGRFSKPVPATHDSELEVGQRPRSGGPKQQLQQQPQPQPHSQSHQRHSTSTSVYRRTPLLATQKSHSRDDSDNNQRRPIVRSKLAQELAFARLASATIRQSKKKDLLRDATHSKGKVKRFTKRSLQRLVRPRTGHGRLTPAQTPLIATSHQEKEKRVDKLDPTMMSAFARAAANVVKRVTHTSHGTKPHKKLKVGKGKNKRASSSHNKPSSSDAVIAAATAAAVARDAAKQRNVYRNKGKSLGPNSTSTGASTSKQKKKETLLAGKLKLKRRKKKDGSGFREKLYGSIRRGARAKSHQKQ